MDTLNMYTISKKAPSAEQGLIRCSAKNVTQIDRIAHACSESRRAVIDRLLEFALARVRLIERPLYEMEIQDIGEAAE